ncbi:hypothetical protein G6M50_26685 [Agrobacterium rhizogenes]|uniref:Uncharacterized protein n=2 Tax=unclassified Rhizobium TaxID=2613769 RepID=A0AAU7SCQ4_9HYPH|nr:hypothetical protein [Rhizobium rhizogenes]NTJ81377.1 hypothetical protein [Rhizobium rhizogenes]
MKTVLAEADAPAARLGVAFGDGARVLQHACGRVLPVRSGDRPSAANDNLVYFAGLVLTGYSDTSGAPSANLPR